MKKTLLSIIMTIGILSSNAQVMEPFFPRDSNLFYQWWSTFSTNGGMRTCWPTASVYISVVTE